MDFRRVGLALLVISAGAAPARASLPAQRTASRSRVARPLSVEGLDNQRRVDVNNLNMFITNFGSYAYDLSTGNAGLVYPRGTQKTAVFAAGIWLGCQVGGQTRTEVAEYSQEYGPGPIIGSGAGATFAPDNPKFKVYKVARWTGNTQDSAHVLRNSADLAADPVADPLLHHSWSEYVAGATPYGAPTRWYHLNPAAPTDSVLGPDVAGDLMMWSVFNDADPSRHTNPAGSSAPLGVEIQHTTFAFNRQGALGNTIFLKWKLYNKGANTLNNMYVSMWADPDLGGFTDDLVGCDTTLSLGFVYNADNADAIYGASPPSVGWDFFLGPVNRANGDTLALTSFNKYINGTDPSSKDQTYNYMQGLNPDGSPVIDPITGLVTRFTNPGDPVTGSGWQDSNPADRRLMLSSGPFQMLPGDSQTVVGAVIVGQGKDRLSSIASLKFNDTFAQDAFNKGFNLPNPPSQPKVDVAVNHGTVTLSWDAASRTNYSEPGYKFEGYNVYQGESVAGPWHLLADYDEIDQVRVIFDKVFDVVTGQIIPQFPVAFGSDLGVQFSHTQTQDAVRGGNLKDGTEYYFAVTAYSYNPVGLPKVLENAQAVVRVTPQRPAGGTDVSTASATPVTYLEKDTVKPPATDVVSVSVVNPSLLTGDVYKVTFSPTVPLFSGLVGTDTATVVNGWSLIDSTKGTTLLSSQLNRRGDDDYRIVDGLKVKVAGKYFPLLQSGSYISADPSVRPGLAGVNFGLAQFGGGADAAINFLGASSIDPTVQPDSFTTVELRFNSNPAQQQKGYRFLRLEKASDGSAPPQGRAYPYAGFHNVPLQAWDTVKNQQLDVAWAERGLTDDSGLLLSQAQQPATNDSTWGPDASALGGREYLWVIRRPYSPTFKAELIVNGMPTAGLEPLMWVLVANNPGYPIADGDKFQFLWANPAIPNDVYVFSTSVLKRSNAALAKTKLDRVRVVPNPYYNRSRYELNQFNRIVRFINLPEACTIRIFNLGGQLIRTLHKSDITTSELQWDLQTQNSLPVASGVYIFHVDAPGVGSTFGRMVIFMEKERLNNF